MEQTTDKLCIPGHDDPADISATRSSKSIHWDEANLEENEKIKAELMPTKINEPKTPYHAPLGESDDPDEGAADMAPLTLEDDYARTPAGSLSRSSADRTRNTAHITIAEASTRLEETRRQEAAEPSMSRSSGGYSSGPDRGYSSGAERCGYTSSDGEGLTSEAKSLKRRRFEQHRKQHYNMKAALQTGKKLAEQDLTMAGVIDGQGATSKRMGMPEGLK
ncbi:hypothetical protein COCSUDRAFT_64907 [Coccomyxa subellipsoidea C-169]|uniref:Protein phosphatase inhibitor 2 n=1 Tax=Coccomyxa subellipsoidea (strain C-169) TaxID=574566 RepID=I0Z5L8_COCSC|nr:hypothetical protein COCSUDRAFT_64907 [Coccomyxa subellipsoidea C-169]EIE25937.1 hypothetical protein COCSUDRAFT_64907 [Coccomyxa subellipsoidea C-169]|eukprot:XP_005650481.1 hypothetical protein COCSUDRAFT_64907 [Coccomyxa subellipsoidea C-169]